MAVAVALKVAVADCQWIVAVTAAVAASGDDDLGAVCCGGGMAPRAQDSWCWWWRWWLRGSVGAAIHVTAENVLLRCSQHGEEGSHKKSWRTVPLQLLGHHHKSPGLSPTGLNY